MVDRIGQQLDKYRITRLLGRGGFADVYLGEHIYLKTPAAIKILQTRLSGSDDLESFLKEARFIAQLSHPHIVRVLDFGVHEETPFLVMEYAPNGTLRERHPSGTVLPLTIVTSYIKQVADALQYAHSEKLVHRDIKPENMLVGRRNDILLSDFGIALIAQSSRYQSTQDVTGTISYMSPEQIQGKPRPASDQYALGIVVYEWLSGDRPFHGSFTELCAQHMFASPPPLREKISTISPDVEHVVMTALAKDPKQRFGSVQAFATALEQASQAAPKVVTPSPPTPQPRPLPQPVETRLPPPMQDKPAPPPAPTQYEPTPPLVPTQLADVTPLPKIGPHVPSTISSFITPPPYQERYTTSKDTTKQVRVWSIGRRQLIAMTLGIALYGPLSYAFDRLFLSNINNSAFVTNIGGAPYLPAPISLLFGLSFVIPFFFGAIFGPWVGLISILAGGLLGDYLSGYITTIGFIWYYYASSVLLGIFPGLALNRTKGSYTSGGAMRTAVMWSALAIVIQAILQATGDAISFHNIFFSDFSAIVLSSAIGLVLLPILLLAYNKIANRKKA